MPKVERNVVTPPNERLMTLAQKRSMSPGFEASDCRPPNEDIKDGDPDNGFMPMTHELSPIQPPNHRFQFENAQMGQPPSAEEPGKGSVPVGPFTPMGRPAEAAELRDNAERLPGR